VIFGLILVDDRFQLVNESFIAFAKRALTRTDWINAVNCHSVDSRFCFVPCKCVVVACLFRRTCAPVVVFDAFGTHWPVSTNRIFFIGWMNPGENYFRRLSPDVPTEAAVIISKHVIKLQTLLFHSTHSLASWAFEYILLNIFLNWAYPRSSSCPALKLPLISSTGPDKTEI